jgi:hypothetical protein
LQDSPALAEGQGAQVGTVEPKQIERDIGGRLRAPQQFVELRSAGLVGGDVFAVDHRVGDAELGGHVVGERRKPIKGVAVARNETISAALDFTSNNHSGLSNGSLRQVGRIGSMGGSPLFGIWRGPEPAPAGWPRPLVRVERIVRRAARRCWPPALPDDMVCWLVSARVGSVKNNDPSLVEPIKPLP